MSSLYQRKGRSGWQAEYQFCDGTTQYKTFATKAEGEAWLAEAKAQDDIDKGPLFGGPERITLGQFLGEYAGRFTVAKLGCEAELSRINHYVTAVGLPRLVLVKGENGHRSLRTAEDIKALPSAFKAHRDERLKQRAQTYEWIAKLARKKVANVTKDDIRMLMTTGKREAWGDSTIQKEVALLKAAFNSAISEWRWKGFENPCAGIKLKKSNSRFVVVTQAMMERLVQALSECDNTQFWPLVDLAIHTTMRMDSLLSLKWSAIDFETRRARVWGKGKWYDAQLPQRAVDILQRMPRGATDAVFTMTPNAVNMAWEGVREKAELPGVTFRDLRHVGATAYAKAGLNVHALKNLLGHSSTRMAEVYVNLANSDVLEALDAADERLDAMTPPPPTTHAHGMQKHARQRKKGSAPEQAGNVFHVQNVDGRLTLVRPEAQAPRAAEPVVSVFGRLPVRKA